MNRKFGLKWQAFLCFCQAIEHFTCFNFGICAVWGHVQVAELDIVALDQVDVHLVIVEAVCLVDPFLSGQFVPEFFALDLPLVIFGLFEVELDGLFTQGDHVASARVLGIHRIKAVPSQEHAHHPLVVTGRFIVPDVADLANIVQDGV